MRSAQSFSTSISVSSEEPEGVGDDQGAVDGAASFRIDIGRPDGVEDALDRFKHDRLKGVGRSHVDEASPPSTTTGPLLQTALHELGLFEVGPFTGPLTWTPVEPTPLYIDDNVRLLIGQPNPRVPAPYAPF